MDGGGGKGRGKENLRTPSCDHCSAVTQERVTPDACRKRWMIEKTCSGMTMAAHHRNGTCSVVGNAQVKKPPMSLSITYSARAVRQACGVWRKWRAR